MTVKKFFNYISYIVLSLSLSGCQFLLPEPPLLSQSPCSGPKAPPPPFPCDPLEKPSDVEAATLPELVDIGLRNNPQTRKAWADARSAAGQLGQANSAWFPQLAITWTGNRTMPPNLPTQVSSPPYSTYSPQFTASYLIWDFGGRNAAIESAWQSLVAAGWNYSWTMQTVMFSIIQNYYGFLGAKALLEGYEQSLNDAKRTLEAAEALNEAGVNTIVDVLQAKSQYYQAKLQVVQQEGQLATSRAQLSVAVGLTPEVCFKVAKPAKRSMHLICCDMKQIMKEATCCRADLEGVRASIKAQRANVDQQFSALWPNVQGQFTGGKTYFHNGGHDNMDFSESIILNIPLFSGFNTVNAIRQAEAQVDSAIAGFKNQELQALLTVVTNYFAVNTALETYENSREAFRYAKEAYEAALFSYKTGSKSIVDVLQAESQLNSARATFIQSEYGWFIAIANFVYARGVLISNEPSDGYCKSLKEVMPIDINQLRVEQVAEENDFKAKLKSMFLNSTTLQNEKILKLLSESKEIAQVKSSKDLISSNYKTIGESIAINGQSIIHKNISSPKVESFDPSIIEGLWAKKSNEDKSCNG
jgi:outer membrane protein